MFKPSMQANIRHPENNKLRLIEGDSEQRNQVLRSPNVSSNGIVQLRQAALKLHQPKLQAKWIIYPHLTRGDVFLPVMQEALDQKLSN
ncbi:hypothetical protein [Acinetobacter sp.]|jgi:hypothetical protein|uniref:hypothetical protein n=1 Tax=Acinetobacter sp. TaxID=472 RepID=UPI0035B329B8